jgi:hypothetical protein
MKVLRWVGGIKPVRPKGYVLGEKVKMTIVTMLSDPRGERLRCERLSPAKGGL